MYLNNQICQSDLNALNTLHLRVHHVSSDGCVTEHRLNAPDFLPLAKRFVTLNKHLLGWRDNDNTGVDNAIKSGESFQIRQ